VICEICGATGNPKENLRIGDTERHVHLDCLTGIVPRLGEVTQERDDFLKQMTVEMNVWNQAKKDRDDALLRLETGTRLVTQAKAGLNHIGVLEGMEKWNADANAFLFSAVEGQKPRMDYHTENDPKDCAQYVHKAYAWCSRHGYWIGPQDCPECPPPE